MVEIRNKKLKKIISNNKNISARQLAPRVFDMNASIYVWNREGFF